MSAKQLSRLLIVVIIVLGVVLVMQRTGSRSADAGAETGVGAKVLPEFPANDIDKVEIKTADGTVNLVRKQETGWCVAERYNYPADLDDIRGLLRNLYDLKTKQVVPLAQGQLGQLELLAPGDAEKDTEDTGTLLTFYKGGTAVAAKLILGKKHMRQSDDAAPGGMGGMMGGYGGGSWPTGRYVRVPNTNKVLLVDETFSSVEPKPVDWLEDEFFKISDLKTGVLRENNAETWRVARDKKGEDLKLVGLAEDKEQDDSNVRSVGTCFNWIRFEDVVDPAATPEQTGMDNPKIFEASDFDGYSYTMKIGKKTADNKYHFAIDVDYTPPAEEETVKKDDDTATPPPDPVAEEKKARERKKEIKDAKKKAADLEKRVNGWVYLVRENELESILKPREELIKKPEKEEKKDGAADSEADTHTDADDHHGHDQPEPTQNPAAEVPNADADKADDADADAAPQPKPPAAEPAPTAAKEKAATGKGD